MRGDTRAQSLSPPLSVTPGHSEKVALCQPRGIDLGRPASRPGRWYVSVA